MGELRDIVTTLARETRGLLAELVLRLVLGVLVVGVCVGIGAGLGWLVGGAGPATAGGIAGLLVGTVGYVVLDLTDSLPQWRRSTETLSGGRRGRRT